MKLFEMGHPGVGYSYDGFALNRYLRDKHERMTRASSPRNDRTTWSRDQQGHSEWQGSLAKEWGLHGNVGAEEFARLSEGRHPANDTQFVKHQPARTYENQYGKQIRSSEHRAGWDTTFSAPKSVSLTALVGGDDRVCEAHRESVSAALQELERYTQARIGNVHAPETTGKFVAASFEHDTARPVDGYAAPQLHTHAVVFNFTERDNGQTRALQERSLFQSQQYATTVYRSELAMRLQGLGYEIERGKHGQPEIKGYSQKYLEASSPRRVQIKEHLQEIGREGAGAAQVAAHRTRDSKELHSPEEVLQQHRGGVEAIEGKTLRGTREAGKKSLVHMVSAWCEANHLLLGQCKVNEKSNEISARPKLLDALALAGTVVTLDAMGCQREIAAQIVGKKADYVLALKGNQGLLAEQVKDSFALLPADSVSTEIDCGHGRVEQSTCSVIGDLSLIEKAADWLGLASLVRIDAERFHKATGKTERETRYYIASLAPDAARLNAIVRQHWSIENKLHWVLDVAPSEKTAAGNEQETPRKTSPPSAKSLSISSNKRNPPPEESKEKDSKQLGAKTTSENYSESDMRRPWLVETGAALLSPTASTLPTTPAGNGRRMNTQLQPRTQAMQQHARPDCARSQSHLRRPLQHAPQATRRSASNSAQTHSQSA
jgi:conjugative relaxase-like TrwC/TraI family protein